MLIIILTLNLQLIRSVPISYPQNSSLASNINNSIVFIVDPNIFNNSLPFQDNKLLCDPNLPCTIFCDSSYACRDTTMICPVNHQCNIICSGSNACQQTNISCPQNHSLLNVDASGQNVLFNFVYPPCGVDDHVDFELNCGSQYGVYYCRGMDVICPAYANCTIRCAGYNSCIFVKLHIVLIYFCTCFMSLIETLSQQMDIIWPEIVGYGKLICDGRDACTHVEFPIPNPNIPLVVTCGSDSECENAVIYCPLYAPCTINCIEYSSCGWSDVYCPLNASCTINCTDRWSCKIVKSYIYSVHFDITLFNMPE